MTASWPEETQNTALEYQPPLASPLQQAEYATYMAAGDPPTLLNGGQTTGVGGATLGPALSLILDGQTKGSEDFAATGTVGTGTVVGETSAASMGSSSTGEGRLESSEDQTAHSSLCDLSSNRIDRPRSSGLLEGIVSSQGRAEHSNASVSLYSTTGDSVATFAELIGAASQAAIHPWLAGTSVRLPNILRPMGPAWTPPAAEHLQAAQSACDCPSSGATPFATTCPTRGTGFAASAARSNPAGHPPTKASFHTNARSLSAGSEDRERLSDLFWEVAVGELAAAPEDHHASATRGESAELSIALSEPTAVASEFLSKTDECVQSTGFGTRFACGGNLQVCISLA